MAQALPLPDGRSVLIREGETPAQTWARAQQMYPEAFGMVPEKEPEKPPKQSTIGSEVVRGAKQLGSSMRTGIETLFGSPEAATQAGLTRSQAIGQAAGEGPSLDRTKQAYEADGLWGATKEVASQIPRAVASQLPQLASMAASAKLGAMAGTAVAPGPGTLVGGVLGAGASLWPTFFGSNAERQAAAQLAAGQPVNIDRGDAALAATGQTAVEAAGTAFMFGKRAVKAVLGITEDAALRTAAARAALVTTAERSLLAATATGVARGLAVEIPVEIAQSVMERAQAGLDVTSPDALSEYGDTAYQTALMAAPIGGAGRVYERSGARSDLAKEEQVKKQAAQAEERRIAAEAKAQEDAFKQTPEYALKVADDYAAAEKVKADLLAQVRKAPKGTALSTEDKAFNTEISKQLKEQWPGLKKLGDEANRLAPTIKQAAEQQRVAGMTPEDYALEQMAQEETAPVRDRAARITALNQPIEQEEAPPTPEAAYVQERMETAGLHNELTVDTTDYVNYLMTDPRMAQAIVTNHTVLPGLPSNAQNAIRGALKLQLKDIDQKRALAEKAEHAQRTEDLKAQKTRTEKDPLALLRESMAGEEEIRKTGEANFDYLDPIFEKAFEGKQPIIGVNPAIKPTRDAQRIKTNIDALIKAVDTAEQDHATAKRAGESNAAANAFGRGSQALAQLQQFEQDEASGPYAQQVLQARSEQQAALNSVEESLDRLRKDEVLGKDPMASNIVSGLVKRAEDGRAAFIKATLQEAAIHRRALGHMDLTTDEALKAASKLYDTFNEWIARVQNEPKRDTYEPVMVEPAQMRSNKIVRQARYEQRKIFDSRPIEGYRFGAYPEAVQVIKDQLDQIRDKLSQVESRAGKVEPLLKTQFAGKEAEKTAEARGENATTLPGQLRRQSEYVGNMLNKALTRDMPDDVREALTEAQAVIEKGRATQALLAATQTQAARVLSGRMVGSKYARPRFDPEPRRGVGGMKVTTRYATKPDRTKVATALQEEPGYVQDVKDALSSIRQLEQGSETVGKVEGQKELFTESVDRAQTDRTLGVIRGDRAKFEAAPPVRKARAAIKAAADALARSKAATHREVVKRIDKLEQKLSAAKDTVSGQRDALQDAVSTAREVALLALENGRDALSPKIEALEKVLRASEVALKKRLREASAENMSEDTQTRTDELRVEVEDMRTALEILRSEAYENADNQILVAAAHQSTKVRFERRVLDKAQERLTKLIAQKNAPSAEVAAAAKVAAEQRRVANLAETQARNDAAVANKAKRELEQRLLRVEASGIKGIERVVGGQRVEVKTAAQERLQRELNDAEQNALDAFAVIDKTEFKQAKHAAGPVTRTQSAAPSQFRAGTEESKGGAGKTAADHRLIEARGTKARNVPITGREIAESNIDALRLQVSNAREEALMATQMLDVATTAEREDMLDKANAAERALDARIGELEAAVEAAKTPAQRKKETREAVQVSAETSKLAAKGQSVGQLYSTSTRGGPTMATEEVTRIVDRITATWKKVPEIVIVDTAQELPLRILGPLVMKEITKSTPGLYDIKSGKVYLIASNLHSENDVVLTVAHEVAGHFGLRDMLGGEYTSTMDRLYAGNPAVKKQADAKMLADPALPKQFAVEEVLASMAETGGVTPAEKGALRQIYDALRVWFRKQLGLPNVTDAEIQQVVAAARKHVVEGGVTAEGKAPEGEALRRTGTAKPSEYPALAALTAKAIKQAPTFKERVGSNVALQLEMEGVNMRAGIIAALDLGAKWLGDTKLATQAMYSLLKQGQLMPMVQAVLEHGPLEMYKDAQGLYGWRSTNKDSVIDVFKAVENLPLANAQAKFDMATAYLAAIRASNKGVAKLDLGALQITQAELDAVMAEVAANPELKTALEAVRAANNALNTGMIKSLAESGAITKAEAATLLKEGDYVPFYRVNANGNADLVFSTAVSINIGDIRHQPYLADLKGGETKIMSLNESLPRNVMLLTDKLLTNMSTRNIAYAFQEMSNGVMSIKKGQAQAGTDIMTFNQEPDPSDPKDTGQRWMRVQTEGTPMEGIPTALLVKSLSGAYLTLPPFLKTWGIASDWLRAGVTRMPMYLFGQLFRDPMSATFTAGLNYGPLTAVAKAGKHFMAMSAGTSKTGALLMEKGLIQSGIFTSDPTDLKKLSLQLASGKDAGVLNRLFAMMDRAAMRADAATRIQVYDTSIANGLSEIEAEIAVMQSTNFYNRGLSPLIQYATRLIPFFNAQIQGLNVLYKAATGQMPFEEQRQIKRQFYNNAMLLVATGVVYAMAMADDEYYKNASPRDRYTKFFVPLPFVKEPLKIPIPYEAGWFFALAVAAVDAMKAETDGKQQFEALRDVFLAAIPGYSSRVVPQAFKPAFEVWANKSFFTGQGIESARMEGVATEERFKTATTEAAKMLSKAVPILSPVQIEHIATGYFGQLPLIVAAAANGLFRREGAGEAPESRITEAPFIGKAFQKKYGGADIDVVSREASAAVDAKRTFDKIRKEGRVEDAKKWLSDHRAEIAAAGMAQNYQKQRAFLQTDADRVSSHPTMNAQEKRARLDKIDETRQVIAERYKAAFKRIDQTAGRTTPP